MIKMKRIYILLLSALTLGATSCNYLDVTPPGKVIPTKVSEYRALMTSAYQAYPKFKHLLSVRSDEVFPLKDKEQAYDYYLDIATWNDVNPNTQTTSFPWESVYKVIFYANTVIDGVMNAEVDNREDPREQIMAEALLMRAFAHFELLNLYGKPYNAATAATDKGIPLATRIDIEQTYVPATVEKTYEQILEDLNEGSRLMQVEEQTTNRRYRFSKKAAKALEARIRLYRSEWELALSAAEEILPSCTLEDFNNTSFTNPWQIDSKESIMAMERVTLDIANMMFILPGLLNKYEQGKDLRFNMFENTGTYYRTDKANGDNMKVTFRSAEIYLIAAEAAAHINGKLEEAKERLLELMKNRLTPEYYTTKAAEVNAMNQQALIAEIADERARELALEGHRWYDLKRTTRPEIVKNYNDRNGNTQRAILTQDDPRYTIRFPREAIENNPNLNN